ncbi:MAG: ATP phosphoribosyltransferase regulatory subunit [Clostridia bacterium]|nr:ATP phosphoribosyltransferase regulatory subunit [Oscillospiraceae bacterium]MBQ6796908.1 ATP phosphoribosyltransferase regulatory subunit [Clostridia bacterium]
MRRYHLITPEGEEELLFSECAQVRTVEKNICKIFSRACYNEVRTPTLEFADVFMTGAGSIPMENMFKLTDNKGRLLVVRPDSTLPIARMTASKLRDAHMPLRIYYNQPSYRTGGGRGKGVRTMQAGIELIGTGGKAADLEVLSLAVNALDSCLDDFRIEIGHSGIFRTLVRKLDISDAKREELRGYIESKNYAALSAELELLEHSDEAAAIGMLPRLFGGVQVLDKVRELVSDKELDEQLSYLAEMYDALSKLGLEDKLMIDLGLVNQNDYYTGIVFTAYTYGSGENILTGGRYDSLIGQFGFDQPACGFAINIDALVKAINPNMTACTAVPDALVLAGEGREIEALKHLAKLGDEGLVAQFAALSDRQDWLQYAKDCGIRRVDTVLDSVETVIVE